MPRIFRSLLPAVLLVVFAIAPAFADVGQRLPRLTRLSDEVIRGGMPLGYVPLREIWSEWDQGDPTQVQATLASLSSDPAVAPPLRVYAGLLDAYARRRRGDLTGSKQKVHDLGFVGRWIVAGPFDNEGKTGLDRSFGPEDEIGDALSMARTYDGKEHQVSNKLTPDAFPYGWVDLGAMIRPEEKVCAYATTFVRDTRAKTPRPFSVWFGSSGAAKVFFDGVEVLKETKYRDLDSDRYGVTLTMRDASWHRLTVKVCGDDDGPMFSLRLADPSGLPDKGLESDPDPVHAKEAAATKFHKSERPPTPVLTGPIPAFERIAGKNGAPSALEAYARYLVSTASDDPAEHQARDLAARAATSAPTVKRCLIAGELAENRNQHALWIDKAEDLVRKNKDTSLDDKIDALLARAAHVRGSANWRDAIPYYDKVLALDPDNVAANLAHVELFSEAGLRDTALAMLTRALDRRPRSVALLRANVAALRELDRTAEMEEVAERYATLRYDDTQMISDKIDLALARRDHVLANRWIERLVETNPDSVRSLATAAKAYVALGDRPKAIATHRKALEIAPEDTTELRALADVYAVAGQTDEQIRLLRQVVLLKPQEKDVREYVAHTEPSKPRADEAYARPAKEFLAQKDAPANGRTRRTLVDLQVTTVFPNGLASRFHQIVFQPLNDTAAAEAREYGFGFQADSETVQLRGAKVYRKNGNIDEAIESGEGDTDDPSMAMYSSARAFYIHFPRLDAGDVVELQYRVEDVAHQNAFADYFGEVTYMQSTEPIAHAEYVLITPKTRTFYFNKPTVPGLQQTTNDQGDSRIWRFTADNVPPLEPEPSAPPLAEALGYVHVSTFKSWDDMGKWYWGFVKDQFAVDDEVRRHATEITKGKTTDKDKIKAVYDFVVQKTRYVALEFGVHGFKPYRCAQIFARGFGDCKDKATLIVSMLKELNIPATIVIVRTGLKGDFNTDVASLAPFDHAIAYVPQFDWYLDGTAEFTGSTELPAMDRGALAIQVNEGKPKVVHLPEPPPTESVQSKRIEATVAPDGSAAIDFDVTVSGSNASSWRGRYHAKATQKARVQEDLANEIPQLDVATVTSNDLDDIEQKVEIKAKGKAPSFARKDADSRTIGMGAREHMVRGYAILGARRQTLRINALTTEESETVVKLPQGAKIIGGPHAANVTSPYGTFKAETDTNGGTVRLKTSIALAKSRIPASEYAAFRAFCEQIDRELGQSLTYTVGK